MSLIFTADTQGERLHRCHSKQLNWPFNKQWPCLIPFSQWTQDCWFEWQQNTPNGKFPTISSRSWAGRRANIDCTPCVAPESPQQMFFFGRFCCPVYFKLLRHSLEVKGLGTDRVWWEAKSERGRGRRWFFLWPLGQRAAGLMRKEQGVMCSRLFTRSYSSE